MKLPDPGALSGGRPLLRVVLPAALIAIALLIWAVSGAGPQQDAGADGDRHPAVRSTSGAPSATGADVLQDPVQSTQLRSPTLADRRYPVHTGIVATTFWVGEIFDPKASDGSQVISTYDSSWEAHYGGCDGVLSSGGCSTERRLAPTFFPLHMRPLQNPFYLDLPFDDVNDAGAYGRRCQVVPWASEPGYAGHCTDPTFSYMKNRWVRMTGTGGEVCYGQIEDAGPGQYDDATYVFGSGDARPANSRYGGAGMDVSPALNGCLGMRELNGDTDRLSWEFVDSAQVPLGPWRYHVTTSGVVNK